MKSWSRPRTSSNKKTTGFAFNAANLRQQKRYSSYAMHKSLRYCDECPPEADY